MEFSIKFSCVNPIQGSSHWPTLRSLICNNISWSQGHSTSPHISESILQTFTSVWTTPDRLKQFGHSNSLYARATRAIVNHTPTSEYQLRFFPNKDIVCPCGVYHIKTRRHTLHECKKFNNYWNLRRDTIVYFTLFLEYNSNAFSFGVG